MKTYIRTGTLIAALALVANVGCSKGQHSEKTTEIAAGDTAGLSEETLLVLKFHHDN